MDPQPGLRATRRRDPEGAAPAGSSTVPALCRTALPRRRASPEQGRVDAFAPDEVFLGLEAMRAEQVAAGQEPWRRCDLTVTRSTPGRDPALSIAFAYEVGEVPGR